MPFVFKKQEEVTMIVTNFVVSNMWSNVFKSCIVTIEIKEENMPRLNCNVGFVVVLLDGSMFKPDVPLPRLGCTANGSNGKSNVLNVVTTPRYFYKS